MKSKIVEIDGRYYLSVGGVIQYECDKEGNRIKGDRKMKDEEMAEEYKEKHICSTCADIQDCGNDCPFSRCGVQAFLAGLKAGRPQWHDLRKDPNDLPKRNGNVVQNQYGDKVTYDYSLKKWRYLDGETNGLKMIAWCEEPTFDKEADK